MIPKHLQGSTAIAICEDMKARFSVVNKSFIQERIIGRPGAVDIDKAYMRHLEGLLLIAVKDALCNADGDRPGSVLDNIEEYSKLGVDAEQRAIAFLNTVLSKG